jgi:hypothetical protein
MVSFLQLQNQSALVERRPTARTELSRFDSATVIAARMPEDRPLTQVSYLERQVVPDGVVARAFVWLKGYFSGRDADSDWSVVLLARQNERLAHRADGDKDVATHTGDAASPSWGDKPRSSMWGSWQ